MRVLISNVDSDIKRGEILVPVRDPSGESWLAGVSSKCDANTAEVVEMNIKADDIYEFQGRFKTSSRDDIAWMLKEIAGYKTGAEVGMLNGKFFLIKRTEHGNFWGLMVSLSVLYTIASLVIMSPLHLIITATMWGCVMAYKHLR